VLSISPTHPSILTTSNPEGEISNRLKNIQYFVIDDHRQNVAITAKAIAISVHRNPYRLAWKFK